MNDMNLLQTSTGLLDVTSSSSEIPFKEEDPLKVDEDLDNHYFESNEEEQVLVNKFLDGEMNFNEYIKNVSGDIEEVDFCGNDLMTQQFETQSPNKKEVIYSQSRKIKKTNRKLPPALKGLMGEANLRVAKGDNETAVKICLEIIRQVPIAPEPFLTLAGIYDEMGEQDKCLQMSLVAAHLSSTDVDQWIHLAEMSEKLGHVKQAVTCYTKAINLDITNMELHEKRASLLENLGDKRTALRGYLRLLSSLKPEQGEQILSIAKYIAEIYHKESDIIKASAALDVAIEKCPSFINSEFINLQLDLLLSLKNYRRCLELMVAFCDLVVEAETNDKDTFIVLNCSIPSNTPIDILAKLIIVLIHMKATNLIGKLIEPIIDLNPCDAGDLHLDIAEAYAEKGYFAEANNIFKFLVHSDTYNLPGVWLKYAENLRKAGNIKDSIGAFYEVLKKVPQHVEARLTLASLLVECGRTDDAISVLTESEQYDCHDVGLLYERCMLLKRDINRAHELIMVSQVLFSRHSTQIRNRDELLTISTIQRYDRKRTAVKQVRMSKKEPEMDSDLDNAVFKKESRKPTVEEEWELFKYICTICVQLKMFSTFQRLTFTAQLSTLLFVYKREIDIFSVIASFLNRDTHNGYNIVRTLVINNCLNVKLWHLFNLIVTKSDDARHNRFIMRQLARYSDHPALGHLHGNNCLVSGTYKYAMHEYSIAFNKKPSPLGALLLGLTYLQMAAQKFTSKKHRLVIQALGLLAKYKDLRGPEGLQEVHYNLGRGFHHLGLFTTAIFHYRKVLEYATLPLAKAQPHIFDLSKEAAFNLHLIYNQSESYDLAKMYIDKYIVV
ncbi:general transcription factor 3C polypeptide 3 [Rhodnius prolixus]